MAAARRKHLRPSPLCGTFNAAGCNYCFANSVVQALAAIPELKALTDGVGLPLLSFLRSAAQDVVWELRAVLALLHSQDPRRCVCIRAVNHRICRQTLRLPGADTSTWARISLVELSPVKLLGLAPHCLITCSDACATMLQEACTDSCSALLEHDSSQPYKHFRQQHFSRSHSSVVPNLSMHPALSWPSLLHPRRPASLKYLIAKLHVYRPNEGFRHGKEHCPLAVIEVILEALQEAGANVPSVVCARGEGWARCSRGCSVYCRTSRRVVPVVPERVEGLEGALRAGVPAEIGEQCPDCGLGVLVSSALHQARFGL